MVVDLPGPVCRSAECERTHKKCFDEMMQHVMENAGVPQTTDQRD
jgi:hypothetical protein